jgi:primosomal protein N'
MYTITVAPLSRARGLSELTYYSAQPYSLGAVVSVPVQQRTLQAIVLACETLSGSKSAIRQATYTLHKLPKQASAGGVPEAIMRACSDTALHHAITLSAMLTALLPKTLLAYFTEHTHTAPLQHTPHSSHTHPQLFQALFPARVSFYRTLIREAFAQQRSIVIVVPHHEHLIRLHEALGKDGTAHCYIVHGALTTKKQLHAFAEIAQHTHPIVALVTPRYAALPRSDIGQYIIEHEHSEGYRTTQPPHIDIKIHISHLARHVHADLLYADMPLSIARIHARTNEQEEEISSGNKRITFPAPTLLVDQTGQKRLPKQPFTTLSPQLRTAITGCTTAGKHALLYVTRRGLGTTTVCNDCGTTITCHICGATMVLHTAQPDNIFLCHSCGAHRTAAERCTHCNSWRLESLGVGAERVEQEVRATFPNIPLFVTTGDSTHTKTQTRKTIDAFFATPGALLLSTAPAVRMLPQHVPLVGVVSMDTLFSLPVWNVHEHIARTLFLLGNTASKQLLIQTRHGDNTLLETLLSGNMSRYYRDELRMREQYGYPPYTVLIKVSVEGTPERVHERRDAVLAHLHAYDPVPLPHTAITAKGLHTLHCFIRIPATAWPDTTLVALLRALPPYARVVVNPDGVL